MPLVLVIALFPVLALGLGVPVLGVTRGWAPLERLCATLAVSLCLSGFAAFAIYLTGLPWASVWGLSLVSLAAAAGNRRTVLDFFNSPELRSALAAWLLVALGALGVQALIVNYSGGGWATDWLEHYQRARFFVERQPVDTLLLGVYPVPARPPLANLISSAMMAMTGTSFAAYQVFSTLLASLAFLPALAFARRWAPAADSAKTTALLVLLFLTCPFWMQNTSFPWTKLPVAFFLLSGLLCLMPGAAAAANLWRARTGWLLLAAALLVHYSAGPWIIGAVLAVAIQRRAELRSRAFWREQLLSLCLCVLVLAPWFVWSFAHYGTHTTLASNTTFTGAKASGLAGQAWVIVQNLFNTLVPHFLRPTPPEFFVQASDAGLLRDLFFNLYQLNLPFLCGSGGLVALAALAWSRFRRTHGGESAEALLPWGVLCGSAVLLGIAVHSIPDEWGLAHICLQPLGLLGLALIAARAGGLPSLLRRALPWLFAFDFLPGVVLPLILEAFAQVPWLSPGLDDAGAAAGLGLAGPINFACKLQLGQPFLGDLARPWQGLVALALVALLSFAGLRARLAGAETAPEAPVTTRGTSRIATALRLGLVALCAAALALAGHWLLFSTFMVYDDEGYVLCALKNFSEHGGLYDTVFSQYGPFFHVFHKGLRWLGYNFTNSAARHLNLLYWVAACALCSGLVWRATRSLLASALCFGVAFFHLWPLISEPSHPGAFICLLVAATAFLGLHARTHPRLFGLGLGIAGAALLLTKINVGVFLIAGSLAWLLMQFQLRLPRRLPAATPALLVGIVLALLPWLLMRAILSESWVLGFAWVASLSSLAVVLSAHRASSAREPGLPPSLLAWGLGGGGSLCLATVLLLPGSTAAGLLDGVLLSPLRMPLAYTGPVNWRAGSMLLPALSLLLALWLGRRPAAQRLPFLLTARLLSAASFLICWADLLPINCHAFALSYGLATAWCFVLPLREDDRGADLRAWLALLLLPQALHAFPVAGSQISWGTFLWIPLAAIGCWDAYDALRDRLGSRASAWGTAFAAPAALLISLSLSSFVLMGFRRHNEGDRLGLPGAGQLVLPESFSSTLRLLSTNALLHADTLFSLPGMYSFNLWTGLPTPTLANATHWFTLLPRQKQDAIQAALEASPRACLIVQREVYDFLVRRGVATESALTLYLKSNYAPAFHLGSHEFWVRKGRAIAAPGTAVLLRSAMPGLPRYKIELVLGEAETRELHAIDVRRLGPNTSRSVGRWDARNSTLLLTPLRLDATPLAEPGSARFPVKLQGLIRLELHTDELPAGHAPSDLLLHLLDAEGRPFAEARFVD